MARPLGTRIVVVKCRTAAIGVVTVVPSDPLPYPSVIKELVYSSNALGGDATIALFDLYLSGDDSQSTAPITGDKLTVHHGFGTTPPDPSGQSDEALPLFQAGGAVQAVHFPTYIPIPGNGFTLKIVQRHLAAGGCVTTVAAVCELYDAPITAPTEDVRPRGTVDQPICVKICEPEIAPPFPPPPGPPPPGPPPPAAGPDVLADPLPNPCEISVEAPLSSVSALCQNTAP